jgi:hypothetical protein
MPLKKISFGEKDNRFSVSKFRGVELAPSIISILDKEEILQFPQHFSNVNGIGSFFCFEGICCEDLGAPKNRYIAPIVVYRIKNLNTREINFDAGVEVQYLQMTEALYDSIIRLNDAVGDINNVDLMLITSNEDFQKFEIEVVEDSYGNPRPCSWRNHDSIRTSVLSYFNQVYIHKIAPSLGKELNASTYLKLKRDAMTSSSSSQHPPTLPVMTNKDEGIEPPIPELTDIEGELNEEDIQSLLS